MGTCSILLCRRGAGELERLAGQPVCARDLVDRIGAVESLTARLVAQQWRDLAGLAAARSAADHAQGLGGGRAGRSAGTEVALALNLAPRTGAGRLDEAVTAVADLPALVALLGAGTGAVSVAGLRKVVKATADLEPALRRCVDAQLVADATRDRLTPGRLEIAALRRVMAADPQAAMRRCARARADRRMSLLDPTGGTAVVWTKLWAEEAVAVHTELTQRATALRAEGDPRPLQTLICDLFIQAVLGPPPPDTHPAHATSAGPATATDSTGPATKPAPGPAPEPAGEEPVAKEPVAEDPVGEDPVPWDLEVPEPFAGRTVCDGTDYAADQDLLPTAFGGRTGPGWPRAPARAGARVELQVVLAASTVLGLDDQPGLLRGYGAIPAALARHIADTANHTANHTGTGNHTGAGAGVGVLVRRLLCDPIDGRLVAMDTKTRRYTGTLRQFLCWRDQTCRLPGSQAAIRDLDHLSEHARGGPTTAGNAQALSKNPHILRDHPHISVRTLPPTNPANPANPSSPADPSSPAVSSPSSTDGVGSPDGPTPATPTMLSLRNAAPTIEWTMPTGHTYHSRPPPALGWGSQPSPLPTPPPRYRSAAEDHHAVWTVRQRLQHPPVGPDPPAPPE